MHQVEAHQLKVSEGGQWDFSPFDNFDDFETLIVGGGGLFGKTAAELLCNFALTQKARKKRVIFYRLGILETVDDWQLVKKAFQSVDVATVRSRVSKELLKKHTGLDVTVMDDPALQCPKASWLVIKGILKRCDVDRNKLLIGVNCAYDGIIHPSTVNFYVPICDFLLRQGCELISINSCIHKWDTNLNDALGIDKINAQLKHGQIKNMMGTWGRGIFHPLEIKGIIARLDMLITYRKHPAYLAYSEDVPIILTGLGVGGVDRIVELVNPLGHFPIEGNKPDQVIDLLKFWLRCKTK